MDKQLKKLAKNNEWTVEIAKGHEYTFEIDS